MFQDVRKKSSSALITLMFAAIIITFVISFGPGDDAGCSSSQNNAGMVNGEVITTSEFRFAYANLYDYYQRIFKEFNNETAKQYNLADKALNSLIGEILVAQKAKGLGFGVSDEEVKNEIVSNPYFQKNGAFDKESYNNMVRFSLNTTISAYEHKVRMKILSKKLRDYILGTISISDTEAKDEFISANEKVDASIYVFDENALKPEIRGSLLAAISDSTATEYLQKNEAKVKLAFEDNLSKYAKKEKPQTLFEDVKLDVARDLLVKDELDRKIRSDSQKFLAAIKENPEMDQKEFETLVPDWNITKKEALGLARKSTFIPNVGFSPKFIAKLFSNPKIQLLDEVVETEEGKFLIASIKEHFPADMSKFEEEKERLKEVLAMSKRAQIYDSYVENLRAQADITLNNEFLKLFENSGSDQ